MESVPEFPDYNLHQLFSLSRWEGEKYSCLTVCMLIYKELNPLVAYLFLAALLLSVVEKIVTTINVNRINNLMTSVQ